MTGKESKLNITPGTLSRMRFPKTCASLRSVEFEGPFFTEPLSKNRVSADSELRAPTFQNSETRYFTRLLFFFGSKSWSFAFGVFLCFPSKSRAPTFCDPTCGPFWQFLTVRPLGASILKWHFSSSSRLGNCKNAKNAVFLTRNPYRLGSFQLGAQNMSKIGSFSENNVFCDTKLNHVFFDIFLGARMLI